MSDDELSEAREGVARAHRAVMSGAYDEARALYQSALGVLRARLGRSHPEVEEVAADLAAVDEMRGVSAFLSSVPSRAETTISPDGTVLAPSTLPGGGETE